VAKPTIEFSTVNVFGWLVVVASCQLKGENPSFKKGRLDKVSVSPPPRADEKRTRPATNTTTPT
jgi:hypothetical protein